MRLQGLPELASEVRAEPPDPAVWVCRGRPAGDRRVRGAAVLWAGESVLNQKDGGLRMLKKTNKI